jgi:serine/threonine-protein kinase RsbT
VNGALPAVASPPSRIEVAVDSELDVHHVVCAATAFCEGHALDKVSAAHVATAASELANNLWMHAANGGHIGLALVHLPAGPAIELRAEDRGPGIADVALAMTEGYSSAGGLGFGLPGVKRLMDDFTIDSAAGCGTQVVARKWLNKQS